MSVARRLFGALFFSSRRSAARRSALALRAPRQASAFLQIAGVVATAATTGCAVVWWLKRTMKSLHAETLELMGTLHGETLELMGSLHAETLKEIDETNKEMDDKFDAQSAQMAKFLAQLSAENAALAEQTSVQHAHPTRRLEHFTRPGPPAATATRAESPKQ